MPILVKSDDVRSGRNSKARHGRLGPAWESMGKGNKVIAPRIPKIVVPITPPRNLLARQLEKNPSVFRDQPLKKYRSFSLS